MERYSRTLYSMHTLVLSIPSTFLKQYALTHLHDMEVWCALSTLWLATLSFFEGSPECCYGKGLNEISYMWVK